MDKKFDIVALGELLIDFTDAGTSADGQKLFEQNPGGAPANLLTAAGRLGLRTAFIGKVGKDMHGAFLKETLEKEGIHTGNLILSEDFFTTLAFVQIDANGERHFSFARKPGADTQLRADEIDPELIASGKIFHFGSLSLTDEPARSAVFTALQIAREKGLIISYDPNYRALLWPDVDTAIAGMKSVLERVDILKVSDEESVLLTGKNDPKEAMKALLRMGPKVAAITMGSEGAWIGAGEEIELVSGFQVNAVDTTGAGDSFWGGFLSYFLSCDKAIEEMTFADWKAAALYGNATASLNVQQRGGIPAMPMKKDVDKIIRMVVDYGKEN